MYDCKQAVQLYTIMTIMAWTGDYIDDHLADERDRVPASGEGTIRVGVEVGHGDATGARPSGHGNLGETALARDGALDEQGRQGSKHFKIESDAKGLDGQMNEKK
jgi:hypothetical protein